MKTHLFNPALLLAAALSSGLAFNSTAVHAIDYSDSTYQSNEHQPYNHQSKKQNSTNSDEQALLSKAQLAQLLAPIALYPDSLLSHILIAASYPLEVIEAYRWRELQGDVSTQTLSERASQQDWDASVIALVPFETVLEQMNKDLTWLRQLGDAFLAQEQDVLDSIQSLRLQAQEAGSLDAIDKVDVEYEQEKIVIVSREPEVVYVPYYDTRVVYGDWRWRHYPPVYWRHRYKFHRHHHDYWPITWHRGVHIGVGFFFSAFHWHNGYVVINHRRNFHNHYRHYYRKRHHILYSGYSKRWHHKPYHRRNVAYRTAVVKEKYRSQYPHKRNHAVRYVGKSSTSGKRGIKNHKHNALQHNYKRKHDTFKRVKGDLNKRSSSASNTSVIKTRAPKQYQRNSAKLLHKQDRQSAKRDNFKRNQSNRYTTSSKAGIKRVQAKPAQVNSRSRQQSASRSTKKYFASANNKKKPVANINSQLRHQAAGHANKKYQKASKNSGYKNSAYKNGTYKNVSQSRKSYNKSANKPAKNYARSNYKKRNHTSSRQSASRSQSRKQRQH
ncbi:DUF3300 domain-containing protein [Thalassotalea euphylliae]|uniref:DUF3300 domain-containing protein n=1 Tax=Thalassotalea euphylliae TaxID=1655234 RepID=A0A3E0U1X9_9GAMM|nr:DUF3300 domain-containing protein [Thalassotalea euphylliae]REL30042.1 DUF3300 domain-containing protein [Thalassotalea euphylliae]